VRDGQDRLPSLQHAVETAAAGFTREPAEPAFTGHVTLGRCRRVTRLQAEMLSTIARTMDGSVFGEWTADRLDVIRSERAPSGSRHTTLASVALQSPTD
jgi:2'-5' RNA ligase